MSKQRTAPQPGSPVGRTPEPRRAGRSPGEPGGPSPALCIAALAALTLSFFVPRLLANPGHFLAGIDVGQHVYWEAMYTKARLSSWSLPLWNPHSYAGHPFLANPGAYVLYPSTLLTALLPVEWAIGIDTLLHVFLAGTGMFLLVRRLSASTLGALCAGVIYAFNGHYVVRIWAGHMNAVHSLTWLPWIVYALEQAAYQKRAVWGVPCAIVLALEFLGGDLQNPYYLLLALPGYVGVRAWMTRSPAPVAALALAVPLALALAAIQILPSLEFFSLSDRAGGNYEFATFVSFPPAYLATLLMPDLPLPPVAEITAYVGLATFVLAAIAVSEWRVRAQAVLLVGVGAFALTIMFGHHTPVFRIYYTLFPGLSSFRIPARSISLLLLSLATLAGLGMAACLEPGNDRRKRALLIGLSALLLALVLVTARLHQVQPVTTPVLRALAFASVPIALAVLWGSPRLRKVGALVVIAGLFVDVLVNFGPRVPLLPGQAVASTVLEDTARMESGNYRIARGPHAGRAVGLGYDDVNSYTPIVLRDYFRFMHDMAGVESSLLYRHTLSWAIFESHKPFLNRLLNVRYRLSPTTGEVFEESPLSPRAFLVPAAAVVPDWDSKIAFLKSDTFDPQATVVLDADPGLPTGQSTAVRSGEVGAWISAYAPERVEVDANSPSPAFLVLADQYYPGWRATIDGTEAPILRADGVLRAVQLPPGAHRVVFTYRPILFYVGAALSCLTALTIAAWAISARRRHAI